MGAEERAQNKAAWVENEPKFKALAIGRGEVAATAG